MEPSTHCPTCHLDIQDTNLQRHQARHTQAARLDGRAHDTSWTTPWPATWYVLRAS